MSRQGHEYKVWRVMRLIGRSVDKKGQLLLESEIEIEGWWSSLT
ncbi:MAG: hypothetical protein ACI84K_002124, partial [Pseudohongiellaceae bacterium]